MTSITFLQVDQEDRQRVSEHFPEAGIIEGIPNDIVSACHNTEILSVFIGIDWTAELLQQLPRLKMFCTRSVGFNHIDLAYCKEHDITVTHVPDYGSHVIAEHVFALLLSRLRHIAEADAQMEKGNVDYHGLRGIALRGKTLGIVGTGRIGSKTAQIAHGFGMRILAVDSCRTIELENRYGVEYVSFEEMLSASDMITLHVPATADTHHMINEQTLAQMRTGVILVNTARGELIHSSALLDALHSGKVQYALLDVLEHEQNFEENRSLIEHPHVVTTPHIAFYAEESMRNMYEDCFLSIDQYLAGKVPDHIVKPSTVICDLAGVQK